MRRVVVLGGAGNFGARIVRALSKGSSAEILVGGRGRAGVTATGTRTVTLDIASEDFPSALRSLSPDLVIHCVGPFQDQDYRVAQAVLRAGAHYLDLADGRRFVAGFAAANDELARSCGCAAISGASTLPALSSAVVDHLGEGLAGIDSIEIAIAPGQRAPRGAATLNAVFSYLGRPVQVWEQGRWQMRTGWMDLRRVSLAFGSRWGALCDVPDLELFPRRYPSVRTVRFHAALEFGIQHFSLWILAVLRRSGLPIPLERWAGAMNRAADGFNAFAGACGGMRVNITGSRPDGGRVRRTWLLTAPATDGPEIPCMAAILLARRLLKGETFEAGARPCMGMVSLHAFATEFARWGMTTRIEEEHL